MKERCRHDRNSWLIAGGYWQWCFVCGALRPMKNLGGNCFGSNGKWVKPTGNKKHNPAMKEFWDKK